VKLVRSKCHSCESEWRLSYSRGLCTCKQCVSSQKVASFVLLAWVVFRIAFGAVVCYTAGLRAASLVVGIYLAAMPLDMLFENVVCYFPALLRPPRFAKCPSCGTKMLSEAKLDGHPVRCETCGTALLASVDSVEQGVKSRRVMVILGVCLFALLVSIHQPILRNGVAFLLMFLLMDGHNVLTIWRAPRLIRPMSILSPAEPVESDPR